MKLKEMKLKNLIEILQRCDENLQVEADFKNNIWVTDKESKERNTLRTLIRRFEEGKE